MLHERALTILRDLDAAEAEATAQAKHPREKHDCARLVRGRRVFDHWMFKEDGRVREIQVQGTLLTNNSEVMHDWALAGRAVTIATRTCRRACGCLSIL